jgi:hypothetical protein
VRRSVALVTMLVTVVLAAAPASALMPERFQPGPNPDFIVEGICDFPVFLHDVVNRVVITDFFDQEGNLTREQGTGLIIEEVSRLDAQGNPVETITRNISGPGVQTFDESGSTLTGRGPWLLFFFPGEVSGFPDGLIWFTTGRFVLRFEDTGEITFLEEPRHQDVCELLS